MRAIIAVSCQCGGRDGVRVVWADSFSVRLASPQVEVLHPACKAVILGGVILTGATAVHGGQWQGVLHALRGSLGPAVT